jgi:hypothetical protein
MDSAARRRRVLAACIVVIACAMIVGAEEAPPARSGAGEVRAYIDPRTGHLGVPAPEALRRLPRGAARPEPQATAIPNTGPGGGTIIGRRVMFEATGVIRQDGGASIQCDPRAAAAPSAGTAE